MTSNEAKLIVLAGLERRKEEQQNAEREAKLEQYEQDMIETCNGHCAVAKVQRRNEESERFNREQLEAKRMARAAALAKGLEREEKAVSAANKYGVSCLAILCLTIFTHLPVWAAITLSLGLAVFPAVYIFRLYYPLEG